MGFTEIYKCRQVQPEQLRVATRRINEHEARGSVRKGKGEKGKGERKLSVSNTGRGSYVFILKRVLGSPNEIYKWCASSCRLRPANDDAQSEKNKQKRGSLH